MSEFVLPTANIVRQFRDYETVFCFYDSGVRGVVRDTVLLSSGNPKRAVAENYRFPGYSRTLNAEGLLEKVIRDYENSVDQRYLENTLGQVYAASFIEVLVEQIDLAVSQMLRDYFANRVYEVCATRWKWIGADMLIRLRFYE